MKMKYFLIIILVIYSLNMALAQSNSAEVDKLALECSKGLVQSCEKLNHIAKNDKDQGIRLTAVKRITDQNTLADIAKIDKNKAIRKTAIGKITDQSIIADLLKYDDNSHRFRDVTFNSITDQNILADVAKNALYNTTRKNAVEKITDQNILSNIANDDKHWSVRKAAVETITDQNILVDIAKNNTEGYCRKAAVEKIADQNILAVIAKNDTDWSVRITTVKKITDQKLLFDIAKNAKYLEPRFFALNGLNGQEFYKQIIEIINQNNKTKHNLAAIGALKIIPKDKILNNNYEVLEIFVKIYDFTQPYTTGTWKKLKYIIEIKTNKFNKSFNFVGRKGSTIESQSELQKIHFGHININEICEFLLSPLGKDDLLKIADESDVVYLRETAAKMLQN